MAGAAKEGTGKDWLEKVGGNGKGADWRGQLKKGRERIGWRKWGREMVRTLIGGGD